jgi:hypothetical protein
VAGAAADHDRDLPGGRGRRTGDAAPDAAYEISVRGDESVGRFIGEATASFST